MTTLYTAKKYAVPALEAHCVEFLTKHLRADNAFMLLTQVRGVAEPRCLKVGGVLPGLLAVCFKARSILCPWNSKGVERGPPAPPH